MKKFWNVVLAMSRATLLAIIACIVLLALMVYRLGSLTPGLSAPEVAMYESANSLGDIISNPVNAPYKTMTFIFTHTFHNAFGIRLMGAAVGIITVILFYLLARKLYNVLTVITATLMFATTSLLLHVSRLASGEVMLLSLLGLISAGYYVRFGRKPELAWIVISIVLGLSLYVPGMVFFIVAAGLWQFRRVHGSFEQLKPAYIAISSAVFSLICAPIIISLIRDFSLWRAYLGLPATIAPLAEVGQTALRAIGSLFIISPADPVHWLGRQPILDVFAIAMFCFGIIDVAKRHKLDRFWTFLGIFVLSIAWIGLSGNQWSIVIVLPFMYLMIATGMKRFMDQWLAVFPRNPIARTTGKILLLAAVVLSVNFQLQRYFVAWPHADATKAAFQYQMPSKTP